MIESLAARGDPAARAAIAQSLAASDTAVRRAALNALASTSIMDFYNIISILI